jgi:hypothetical protein
VQNQSLKSTFYKQTDPYGIAAIPKLGFKGVTTESAKSGHHLAMSCWNDIPLPARVDGKRLQQMGQFYGEGAFPLFHVFSPHPVPLPEGARDYEI